MIFNDKELGTLTMLMPAAPFGVDEEKTEVEEPVAEPVAESSASSETAAAETESANADSENASAETEVEQLPPAESPEKAKKKLDKVLKEVQPRIGEEVGGLIGGTLAFSDFSTQLISKEDFFDEPAGKLIFAEMQITGDVEGNGCLLIPVKDAVRLGGTLIMLPDSELEEVVASEDYSEEIEDSYGEIANIIAGSYTKTFEEMYPKSCRFIRKEQQLITPIKVDGTTDDLIPNQNYYQVSNKMTFNDKEMGTLIMLIPAAPFGVDEIKSAPESSTASVDAATDTAQVAAAGSNGTAADGDSSGSTQAEQAVDVQKQKKRVDSVLELCQSRMQEEVGAILGSEITLSEQDNRLVSKEDYFFDEASGKQILAHMDVVGEVEDKSFLFVGLKDAIFIGGTLIMLPPSELDVVVADEEFSDDTEDAYGEITNIIAGVFTSVFEEQYPKQFRFVKTHLEKVIPLKVDTDSDAPMPDQNYYMSSCKLTIGDSEMGKIQMLFPAPLLELDQLGAVAVADTAEEEERVKGEITSQAAGTAGGGEGVGSVAPGESANPAFLLVSNDPQECEKITTVLTEKSLPYKVLTHKESVGDYLPGEVQAIFLLMTEVNENGMGVAIKISGASSLPLIAAGPGWTRSTVIKAVKYGVDDILLTPASQEDIGEKINSLTASMAA